MGIFKTNDANYARTFAEESAMVDASELIAAALESSGMSRSDLAEALEVNKSEITARLKGERNITVRSLARTLHELGSTLTLSASNDQRRRATRSNVIYLRKYMPNTSRQNTPVNAGHIKTAFGSR